MDDCSEPAISAGGQCYILYGAGAVPIGGKHLLAAEHQLYRAPDHLCSHGGQDGVGPEKAFRAKAAAYIMRDHPHFLGRHAQQLREHSACAEH